MVGNRHYSEWHEGLKIQYSRNVNGADGVPYMPPSCGGEDEYRHVGPTVNHPYDNR